MQGYFSTPPKFSLSSWFSEELIERYQKSQFGLHCGLDIAVQYKFGTTGKSNKNTQMHKGSFLFIPLQVEFDLILNLVTHYLSQSSHIPCTVCTTVCTEL